MVLYKRKQVHFVRPPTVPQDLNTQIYVIPQTREWFLEYDEYLERLDYYHRRKFVCEITGNSCLTFFEAYDSENKEIKAVEQNFPEALREHILRFLQFNRISRLDQLVDKVYLVFKNEYFPGEEIFVKVVSGKLDSPDAGENPAVSTRKQRGTIREKVQYANPSDTKYLVSLMTDGTQIIATNSQISRDRNHFTKWLIKTFVKLSVTRSHKVGAPWVVKQKYAKKYRIPQDYPEDLKTFESTTPSGEILYEEDITRPNSPTPQLVPIEAMTHKTKKQKAPKTKSLKKKATLNAAKAMDDIEILTFEDTKEQKQPIKDGPRGKYAPYHLPPLVRKELDDHEQLSLSSIQPSKKTMVNDLQLSFDIQNPKPQPVELHLPENALLLQKNIAKQIQDEVEEDEKEISNQMDTDANGPARQAIETRVASMKIELASMSRSTFRCIQEALECWAFLNIYHSVLNLDTFTFDDFLCAMSWNSEQYENLGRCELLDEIWCAALSGIISNEIPTGKDANRDDSDYENLYGLQVTLPSRVSLLKPQVSKGDDKYSEEDSRGSDSEDNSKTLKSEDDASEEESGSDTPKKKKKGQQLKANGSAKSSSVNGDAPDDSEANDTKNEKGDEEESEADDEEEDDHTDHVAHKVKNYRGMKWHDRLRKRNFKDGNWQIILLGVLSMVEYVPAYQPTIQAVYRALAPALIQPSNASTVLSQFYSSMSVDLRMKTLHILTSLLINGTLVRGYIDECLEQSTSLRRTRLDVIRDYKDALGVATKAHTGIFDKLFAAYDSNTDAQLWANFNRRKPRFHTKGYSLTEYEQSLYDNDEEFQKLWKERDEYIEKVKALKEDLRKVETRLTEIDCQRVRLLGKDRHFNRYWWFENNGLPNLHFSSEMDEEEDGDHADQDEIEVDDKDDVQDETYLMGRLWIQGPSVADITQRIMATPDELKLLTIAREEDAVTNGVPIQKEFYDLQDGGAPLRVMNFDNVSASYKASAEKHGIQFDHEEIRVNGTSFIDRLGAICETQDVVDLNPIQRKIIEEMETPLTSGDDWRYYDDQTSVDRLINWLNPWGVRESSLKKELLRVKDALITSITARRKALLLDNTEDNVIVVEGPENGNESKDDPMMTATGTEGSGDEDDDSSNPRKRHNRELATRLSKRQKTLDEVKGNGFEAKVQNSTEEKRIENQVNRVLEWVNSKAKDAFDKTLYEGGEKAKPKPRKVKK